eukprot:SAG22_NODE_1580_length_4066_cov_3.253844_4_plen_152_part_01
MQQWEAAIAAEDPRAAAVPLTVDALVRQQWQQQRQQEQRLADGISGWHAGASASTEPTSASPSAPLSLQEERERFQQAAAAAEPEPASLMTEEDRRRQGYAQLHLSELRKQAVSAGVAHKKVAEALDSDNPRESMTALLLAAPPPPPPPPPY